MMTDEEKDKRIKELEEFIENIIENVYYYGSPIWREKSCGHFVRAGSIPASTTKKN